MKQIAQWLEANREDIRNILSVHSTKLVNVATLAGIDLTQRKQENYDNLRTVLTNFKRVMFKISYPKKRIYSNADILLQLLKDCNFENYNAQSFYLTTNEIIGHLELAYELQNLTIPQNDMEIFKNYNFLPSKAHGMFSIDLNFLQDFSKDVILTYIQVKGFAKFEYTAVGLENLYRFKKSEKNSLRLIGENCRI